MKHIYTIFEKFNNRYFNENFWKWFGDSKIVNKDGSPMKVYHGTVKDFDSFETPNHFKDTEGYYFTNDTKYASKFSLCDIYHDLESDESPCIMPVYLSIQNPYVIKMSDRDLIETLGYSSDFYNEVKNGGYDGVMLEDLSQIFVFKNTQIKSAYGNNGNFDSKNSNINESNMDWSYKKRVRELVQDIEFYKRHAEREVENNKVCHPNKVRDNSQRYLEICKKRYKDFTGEDYI